VRDFFREKMRLSYVEGNMVQPTYRGWGLILWRNLNKFCDVMLSITSIELSEINLNSI